MTINMVRGTATEEKHNYQQCINLHEPVHQERKYITNRFTPRRQQA